MTDDSGVGMNLISCAGVVRAEFTIYIIHIRPWKNNRFLKPLRMQPKSSVHSNYCYLFTIDKSPFH